MTRSPFPTLGIRTTAPLQVVHTDVAGPMEVATPAGSTFFVGVIDDYTRFKAIVPVKTKGVAKDAVMAVVARWENQTGSRVRVILSDNGLEYTGGGWPAWLAAKGIQHQTTARYTPQSNGVAERYNRVVAELTVAALAGCKLDAKFWGEAAVTVNYLGNRVVGRDRPATPYELFYGTRPDVGHLRPFGCRAWLHIPAELRKKLQPRAVEGIFVGYGIDQRGYRVLVGDRVETSRDVWFDEPRALDAVCSTEHAPTVSALATAGPLARFPDDLDAVDSRAAPPSALSPAAAPPAALPESRPPPLTPPASAPGSVADAVAAAQRLVHTYAPNGAASGADSGSVGEDAGAHTAEDATSSSDSDSSDAAGVAEHGAGGPSGGGAPPAPPASRHPARLLRAAPRPRGLADLAWAFTATGRRPRDKMRISQARHEPDWPEFDAAVQREVNSLWEHGTWYLTDLPPGKTVTDTEILCERKRGPEGELVGHKGRFVGRGDKQTYLVDYTDVFAPVARYATLRALLAHCAASGLILYQLDVETAFLNGEVDEEIYIRQPRGYERGDKGKVCRLVKALYGLKQAARAWHKKLDTMLGEAGFTACASDPCLYKGERDGVTVYILVYVDDLLVAGATNAAAMSAKAAITTAFKAREMGEPTFFLGLHVERDTERGTLRLGQRQYVHTILERFGLADANPVQLPMGAGDRLTNDGEPLTAELQQTYQELVGALLYLATGTRPDIAYAVGQLSRYVAAPTGQHLAAAKRVLRYLKGTATLALTYGGDKGITGYSDADYAEDVPTRRSTTGYIFTMHGAAVSWTSKRQGSVALSTTEAEYVAGAMAAREAVWVRRLLKDLTGTEEPLDMRIDNQSALALMRNDTSSQRTKHIDVAFHFVREKVADKVLVPTYIPTGEMVADMLTKALPIAAFTACREAAGLSDLTL